ncbi:MAG: PQQ-binding-like beta-propeller repeat protein [Bryobacteraceae bacterium]|jgi:outer membrane protein assembly factor BamB
MRPVLLCLVVSGCLLLASDTGGDWPMWGGTPERNMVSSMQGIPTSWDIQSKKNVKWVAQLGSQTYGNPVVAGGQVYVGTNNDPARDPKEAGDRGVLMCFRESDGHFLWQHTSQKLADSNQDWPETGVCSAPLVEADRVYYLTNRCELVCLDAHGDGHGNAKVVWKLDMIKELGVSPHNKAASSPASFGGLVFVGTSNGRDENHTRVPAPKAPSMIAVDQKTGKLAWQVNDPGDRILDGQWSSPAVGAIGGVVQVVIGEGDGWVRGYEALTGKKLWEFDTNPKDSVWPRTRNEIVSTPVIWQNRVFIANGQDPESGQGPGHLYAIDATKRGDITATGRLWHYDKIKRSISTGAIWNGLLFYADFTGYLHCLDVNTGQPYWTHDTLSAVWGSPMVIDGKVYLGDEDGDVLIMQAGKQFKLIATVSMGSNVYSTPVPAGGTLFVANRNQLFAIAQKP